MDLTVATLQTGARLMPGSVLGLLWLQIHFETSAWPRLARGQARISHEGVKPLVLDAQAAGLTVALLPRVSEPVADEG